VFRQGLIQMLSEEEGLQVAGFAADATTALREVTRLKPDLVLVDISLPGKSGLDLIKEVRTKNQNVKMLVVSMHDEALYADRVLRAGGDGYVMKQQDPEEIIFAIRDVLAGHIYVSEAVMTGGVDGGATTTAPRKSTKLAALADEELELLELLGQGRSEPEIARQFGVGVAAVARQCKRMQKKLQLKSANALVRYAVCWVEENK